MVNPAKSYLAVTDKPPTRARGRRNKWTPKAHTPPPISEREARLQSRRTRLQVLDLPGAAASPPAFSATFPLEPTHIHESSSKPHWKSSLEDVFEDVEPAGSSQRGFSDDVDATHSHSPVRLRRSINEVDLSPGSEKKLYEPQIRQRVDYSSLQSRRSMTSLQGMNCAGSSKRTCSPLVMEIIKLQDTPTLWSEWWQYLASSLFKLSKTTLPPQSTRMAETDWVLDVSLSKWVVSTYHTIKYCACARVSSPEMPTSSSVLDLEALLHCAPLKLSQGADMNLQSVLSHDVGGIGSVMDVSTCRCCAGGQRTLLSFTQVPMCFTIMHNGSTVRWTPDARGSDLVFCDDTGLQHRRAAIGPDGELQWHQFDGLNPMVSIAHLATELVPDLRDTASYSWWVYKRNRNALRSLNTFLTRRWTISLKLMITDLEPSAAQTYGARRRNPDVNAEGPLLPTVTMARQRYEVMGLELGVVEEGAQAGRQTFRKIRVAGSARKYQIDKLRILEKAIGLHPGHSLFEDEYRAHNPVMVKLRCPTCAAGRLCRTPIAFTQDLIRCNLCGLYLHKLHAEISKEERRTTRCIICVNVVSTKDLRADEFKKLSGTITTTFYYSVSLARSCAWAYISEAWRLVEVHDYGVHRDGLGTRALAEVSCPEEGVNLQLVPGNKLAWSFSNAKQLEGSKNREIYLSVIAGPTEAILKKTWGTNASLVKTFIKDTKKTIKHLNVGK
ncbi:BZ3501_MvSof-1269-A2-R1_Chr12-3g03599 [Microbotryum saponariae]|nr:BZ3501_MvSof-1269-A2-R1_Chr12-3g03599 [Microbotryum saponariae]